MDHRPQPGRDLDPTSPGHRSLFSAGSGAVWSSHSYNQSEPRHKPHLPDLRNAVHVLPSGCSRGTRYVPNDGSPPPQGSHKVSHEHWLMHHDPDRAHRCIAVEPTGSALEGHVGQRSAAHDSGASAQDLRCAACGRAAQRWHRLLRIGRTHRETPQRRRGKRLARDRRTGRGADLAAGHPRGGRWLTPGWTPGT